MLHAAVAAPLSLHRLRRRVRAGLLRLAAPFAATGDVPVPDLSTLERVLLVYVNFRLGNTVLATPGVAALTESCPRTRFDFVGGPAAPAVMQGQRLGQIRALSRSDVGAPHRLAQIVAELRRQRYAAAIHLGLATSSLGGLLVCASGATHRIGCRRRQGNVYFPSAVEPSVARHKVDRLREYVARLGIPSDHERRMEFAREEVDWAVSQLAGLGAQRRVALFVGGRARKGKGWPLNTAACVASRLRGEGLQPVVFIGPEERTREREIRRALSPAMFVAEPDVRRVAALLSCCAAVVTPDAGPMHLAIASGAPTVAVFRQPDADRWGPRAPHGESILDPEGQAVDLVVAAVHRHMSGSPGWAAGRRLSSR
jgi:ADP-heptose:LPS heptosyltransferase